MLLGSTEWAETHADELKKKAVLYINSDTNGRGFLSVGGSQDFQHLVNEVAGDVIDPETGVSIGQRLRAKIRVDALAPDAKDHVKAEAKIAADPDKDFPIEPLGSGSDFSSFLQHLGVPALDLGFGDEGKPAASITRATTPSSITAASSIRASSMTRCWPRPSAGWCCAWPNRVFPCSARPSFADAVSDYLDEVKKLADDKREEAETQAGLLRDRAFQLAADPTKSSGLPTPAEARPAYRVRGARRRGRSTEAQRQGL